jgi:chemotaxis response regulator CheB
LPIEMACAPIAVLVADPQPLFRDAVARIVHQHAAIALVAELGDGRHALAEIVRSAPAVAAAAVLKAAVRRPATRPVGALPVVDSGKRVAAS